MKPFKSFSKNTSVFLVLATFFSGVVFAQEENLDEEAEGKHGISFVMSHTYIGEGRDEFGDKEFKSVPSFAIDYNYWLSEKFAIGLHTDFLNETLIVESNDEELIERERPIAPLIMGTYTLWGNWNVGLGFGAEFASGETYFVAGLALEYVVEIHNGWGVLGTLTHDFRANVYNATSIGIGIEKRFGK